LGLIRQAQRQFDIDYCVQLSFENINAPELGSYGVDHVKVVEGLGCKAVRVTDPEQLATGFAEARRLMEAFSVPVVVEVILNGSPILPWVLKSMPSTNLKILSI
jgi:tartronate-semialdehyde synthase